MLSHNTCLCINLVWKLEGRGPGLKTGVVSPKSLTDEGM